MSRITLCFRTAIGLVCTIALFCLAGFGTASAQCVPAGCTDYTVVVASNVACNVNVASVWGTTEHDRASLPPGVGAIFNAPCDGTTFAGANIYDANGVKTFVPFNAACPPAGQVPVRISAGCCVRVCAALDPGGCPEIRITAVIPACP